MFLPALAGDKTVYALKSDESIEIALFFLEDYLLSRSF